MELMDITVTDVMKSQSNVGYDESRFVMPTTINTIEDLIQLLDDNPQWVQALRARLLTRELIELPESFARFRQRDKSAFLTA